MCGQFLSVDMDFYGEFLNIHDLFNRYINQDSYAIEPVDADGNELPKHEDNRTLVIYRHNGQIALNRQSPVFSSGCLLT